MMTRRGTPPDQRWLVDGQAERGALELLLRCSLLLSVLAKYTKCAVAPNLCLQAMLSPGADPKRTISRCCRVYKMSILHTNVSMHASMWPAPWLLMRCNKLRQKLFLCSSGRHEHEQSCACCCQAASYLGCHGLCRKLRRLEQHPRGRLEVSR